MTEVKVCSICLKDVTKDYKYYRYFNDRYYGRMALYICVNCEGIKTTEYTRGEEK